MRAAHSIRGQIMASFLLRFRFSALALFLWASLFTGFLLDSLPCHAQEKAGLELL